MRINEWLRPGYRIKRWLGVIILGITCICIALTSLFGRSYISEKSNIMLYFFLILGCSIIFVSVKFIIEAFLKLLSNHRFFQHTDKFENAFHSKKFFLNGPNIISIGGGTGLSTMLRGLKKYTSNLTAIVTVADDGGGSGVLRDDLGIVPPGDIRNCILALADTEPIMQELLKYRFPDGMLKGQSFGNLFLAAMNGISMNFEEAVKKMSDVLAVTGNVLPVSLDNVNLCAELEDGTKISGESNISSRNDFLKIKKVFLEPENIKPLDEAIDAILKADVIILGPGSLYTSIIPNLLVNEVCEAIKKSKATKVYVCNVMTQMGETNQYSVLDHIEAIEKHSYEGLIDYCIVNTTDIPVELKEKYLQDGSQVVKLDFVDISKKGIKIIGDNLIGIKDDFIRHDSKKLAKIIIDLALEEFILKDRKRLINYQYIKEKLKKTAV